MKKENVNNENVNVNANVSVSEEPRHYDVLENLLDRYRIKLKETTHLLDKTRRDLDKSKQRLERLDNEYAEAKRVADKSMSIIKKQLFKWLSKESQHRVIFFLRFYHQANQLNMLDAMMTYAVTGKKAKLEKPVAQWHFRLFCEMLDNDRYTVPSHTLLVRLWEKVGLFQNTTQNEKADGEPNTEEPIRPFDQEW